MTFTLHVFGAGDEPEGPLSECWLGDFWSAKAAWEHVRAKMLWWLPVAEGTQFTITLSVPFPDPDDEEGERIDWPPGIKYVIKNPFLVSAITEDKDGEKVFYLISKA